MPPRACLHSHHERLRIKGSFVVIYISFVLPASQDDAARRSPVSRCKAWKVRFRSELYKIGDQAVIAGAVDHLKRRHPTFLTVETRVLIHFLDEGV